MQNAQGRHQLVDDRHHLIHITTGYRLSELRLRLVAGGIGLYDFRLAGQLVEDRVVRRELDAGVRIRIALSMTLGYCLKQILLRDQGASPFQTLRQLLELLPRVLIRCALHQASDLFDDLLAVH